LALAVLVCLGAALTQAQAEISISRLADLQFGQIVSTGSPGTVTVSPTGGRTASGGATLAGSSWVSAASFTVSGDPNLVYGIVLPGSVTLSSGSHSMSVGAFTSDPPGLGLLGPGGTQPLTVGATLILGAQQPTVSYAGTFHVVVAYN
jgi:hypothetical protein